jgi:hypothetical protein
MPEWKKLREKSRMAQVCSEVVEAGLWQPGKRLLQLWCNDDIGCFSIRRRQALRRRLHPSNKKVISKSMAAG